ncbi:hypothetical protein GCM10025770_07490 [Viridibacterium curvum]|uniref:Transposase n=1 Tax=Viridibacterium curvum TaxID=1101404 RepID=A0ABP9QDN0_9RHOO
MLDEALDAADDELLAEVAELVLEATELLDVPALDVLEVDPPALPPPPPQADRYSPPTPTERCFTKSRRVGLKRLDIRISLRRGVFRCG